MCFALPATGIAELVWRLRLRSRGLAPCIQFSGCGTNVSEGPTTHIFSVVLTYHTTWRYFA